VLLSSVYRVQKVAVLWVAAARPGVRIADWRVVILPEAWLSSVPSRNSWLPSASFPVITN
jgi:hypothetical protein